MRQSGRNRRQRKPRQNTVLAALSWIPKQVTITKPKSPRYQRQARIPPSLNLLSPVKEPAPKPPESPPLVSARRTVKSPVIEIDWVMEEITRDIEAGMYLKRVCMLCKSNFFYSKIAVLSCGHVCHSECLREFRKNSNPRNHCCPFCRKSYHFIDVYPENAYPRLAANLIQRVFRGYMVRKTVGDIAPPGSILHRKWVLGRAQTASTMLVSAIENQSDVVDAILASIDKELDWARTVMNAVEVQEREIDWADVKCKVLQRGCGNCSICLRNINSDECSVTSCEHCFHQKCLSQWMQFCQREDTTVLCPVCRSAFQHRPLYGYKENFADFDFGI